MIENLVQDIISQRMHNIERNELEKLKKKLNKKHDETHVKIEPQTIISTIKTLALLLIK